MTETTDERFWSKVDKTAGPDGCWVWTAGLNSRGYGVCYVPGKPHMKAALAHRRSFEMEHGFLPVVVRHRCDNPPCVNPAHLLGGTHADNTADMVDRGRQFPLRENTCRQGHALTPENTGRMFDPRRGRFYRRCKACSRAARQRHEQRRKANA